MRVRRDPDHGPGPWPSEPFGTIGVSPHDGSEFSWVRTTRGPVLQYWIVFDELQRDAEGDGPYTAGDVLEIYVEPVAT